MPNENLEKKQEILKEKEKWIRKNWFGASCGRLCVVLCQHPTSSQQQQKQQQYIVELVNIVDIYTYY